MRCAWLPVGLIAYLFDWFLFCLCFESVIDGLWVKVCICLVGCVIACLIGCLSVWGANSCVYVWRFGCLCVLVCLYVCMCVCALGSVGCLFVCVVVCLFAVGWLVVCLSGCLCI